MSANKPLVSVIIPTINRPRLLLRAIQSVLNQTLTEFELIVIVDGPDRETMRVLQGIGDNRLRFKEHSENRGVGAAFNNGINDAQADWIALLDDDDEWLPQKLEIQMQSAVRSSSAYPIISCHIIVRTEAGDMMWPRRLPNPKEPLCEYLFCQHGLRSGEGVVLPSTILARRELFKQMPWRVGVPRHNDFDWLLRVIKLEGAAIEFAPQVEPLIIYHMEENRHRVSRNADWRYSLSWADSIKHLITHRAYASFLLTTTSQTATRTKQWEAFWRLPMLALRYGSPRLIDFLAHLAIWLVPLKVRQKMVAFSDRRRLQANCSQES